MSPKFIRWFLLRKISDVFFYFKNKIKIRGLEVQLKYGVVLA
jgi:hypothetical protein